MNDRRTPKGPCRVNCREARVQREVGGPSGNRDHRQSQEIRTLEPDDPDISRFRLAPNGRESDLP